MSDTQGAQLGPVTMFSAKRADVVRFYADVAGLSPDDSGDVTWFEAGEVRIAVHEPTDRQTPPEIRTQAAFVVWLGVPDVRAVFERAKAAGATVGEFHGDFFYARDPEGRYLGFYGLEDGHAHDHAH